MDIATLLIIVIFGVLIGIWANAWGRNPWGWGIAGALLSPLVVGIILIFAGKSLDKKAEEAALINEIMQRRAD